MKNTPISREHFDIVYQNLNVSPRIDRDFIYDAYCVAIDGANDLAEANVLGREIPINPVSLILYLINEYGFYIDTTKKTPEEIKDNDDAARIIISTSLDKYFTNEHLDFKNETRISKFSPQISTLSLYINFILGVLTRYRKREPKTTLITDILQKGFSMAKAILELMTSGFETEAFSTWRTLHETECILILLARHGEKTIKSYLRHMDYAIAYRGIIPSKEETDAIFVEIKENMHQHDLKSKDMKKYIEYGWLYSIDGAKDVEGFKLNFRDGVERVAKLSEYSANYEMASEIAHSSPLMIYSKSDYYLHLVLLNLFESFFRLEKIFTQIYLNNISKEEAERYLMMRNLYYSQLEVIYHSERQVFTTKFRK